MRIKPIFPLWIMVAVLVLLMAATVYFVITNKLNTRERSFPSFE